MSYRYENLSECPCCDARFSTKAGDDDDAVERIAEHVAEEHPEWVLGIERSFRIFERARAVLVHTAARKRKRGR